ncbi:Bug family tripartite tricarboxylate transporter substrate binding protein [Cupriavidus necator]
MTMHRLLSGLLLAAASVLAHAEEYPVRPVRVVVPFAAGSGTDILTRLVVGELQKEVGGAFVVDNRPGASGQIAAEAVARAQPDGYTLMVSTNTAHSANPYLFKKISYDPIRDFTPIGRINYFVFVLLVNAQLPVKTTDELIAYARRQGKISYAYGNATGQVAAGILTRGAKLNALPVPYKSTPPAMTDLAAGQVDFLFVDWASAQPFLKGGRVRAIGVQADNPSPLVPNLPAVGKSVPGYSFIGWGGLFGPAGLPVPIVQKLNDALLRVLAKPSVRQHMAEMGLEPAPAPTPVFRAFVHDQLGIWGGKISEAGVQAE